MDHFHYKEDELFAEDVALKNVADKYGTPALYTAKLHLKDMLKHI